MYQAYANSMLCLNMSLHSLCCMQGKGRRDSMRPKDVKVCGGIHLHVSSMLDCYCIFYVVRIQLRAGEAYHLLRHISKGMSGHAYTLSDLLTTPCLASWSDFTLGSLISTSNNHVTGHYTCYTYFPLVLAHRLQPLAPLGQMGCCGSKSLCQRVFCAICT